MQVIHLLPAVAVAIDDEPVTSLGNAELAGKVTRHDKHAPDQRPVGVADVVGCGDGLVGDDEDMHGRPGLNVPEGRDFLVAVDNIGRQLPGDDAFKQGWHGLTIIRGLKTSPEILANGLEKSLAPVYLISGDEPLTAGEAADAVRAAAKSRGFEREVFFVDRANSPLWGDILTAAQSLSLFTPRRLIEVRMPGGKPGNAAKSLQELVALASADLLVVVITGALDFETQKSAWVQAIDRAGCWVVADGVSVAQFPQWLRRRAQVQGITLHEEAVAALAEQTEGNLLAAMQELQKLALSGLTSVSGEQVLASVTQSSRFDLGQLGEALLLGNTVRALRVLAGLRAEGVEGTLVLWSIAQELRMVWMELVPGAPIPAVWSKNRKHIPAAAMRLKARGRGFFAQLNERAVRADRMNKGQMGGCAWDEIALLVVEICTANIQLAPAA
jgi:DNA polymerase III subunit delta